MTAVAIDASRAANPALGGPVPARTGGPAAADRSPTVSRPGRAIRSWPPRPRLRCSPGGSASRRRPASAWSPRCRASGPRCTWTPPSPSRSASTYAAYALRAWLARDQIVSDRTRRFAKWSAICSFALGCGQVACHLMTQAGMAQAPWPVTTLVSCLQVLVLAMGTALAHMLRADAEAVDVPDSRTRPRAVRRSRPGLRRTRTDQAADNPKLTGTGPSAGTRLVPSRDDRAAAGSGDLTRGPRSHRWSRPALSPAGSPQRGDQYRGERCAAPESRAPIRP